MGNEIRKIPLFYWALLKYYYYLNRFFDGKPFSKNHLINYRRELKRRGVERSFFAEHYKKMRHDQKIRLSGELTIKECRLYREAELKTLLRSVFLLNNCRKMDDVEYSALLALAALVQALDDALDRSKDYLLRLPSYSTEDLKVKGFH